MNTPNTQTRTVAIQAGVFHRAAQLVFALLSFGFLLGGFQGAVSGNFLFPFGFVLAATFGLLTLLFRFTSQPENF